MWGIGSQQIVAETCEHYKPAVIYDPNEPLFLHPKKEFGRKKNLAAYSEMEKIGFNKYKCKCCGLVLGQRENRKIDKIVEYLNLGGNDDKELAAMFQGIEIGQVLQIGKMEVTEGAVAGKNYVPQKNITKYQSRKI